MSGATSRARAQVILHHWRDNIFGFEGQIQKWFDGQQFSRIEEFGFLGNNDVDNLEYVANDGTTSLAPKQHRVRVKAALGYYHYVQYHHNVSNTMDILLEPTINTSSFDRFHSVEFNPEQDIVSYTSAYVQTLELNKARIEREVAEKEKVRFRERLILTEIQQKITPQ